MSPFCTVSDEITLKKIFRSNFYSRAVLGCIGGQIWPADRLLRTPEVGVQEESQSV